MTRASTGRVACVFFLIGALACGDDDAATTDHTVKAPSELHAEPLDAAAHLTWKDNSDDEAEFTIERNRVV